MGTNPSGGSHHLLTAVHCMIISVVGVVELLRLDAQPQCLESGCATVWKCSDQALIGQGTAIMPSHRFTCEVVSLLKIEMAYRWPQNQISGIEIS